MSNNAPSRIRFSAPEDFLCPKISYGDFFVDSQNDSVGEQNVSGKSGDDRIIGFPLHHKAGKKPVLDSEYPAV